MEEYWFSPQGLRSHPWHFTYCYDNKTSPVTSEWRWAIKWIFPSRIYFIFDAISNLWCPPGLTRHVGRSRLENDNKIEGGGGARSDWENPCEHRHGQRSHSAVGWILTTKEGAREGRWEREREDEKWGSGRTGRERTEKRVKASTRQNINLYVNRNKAGGLEAALAVLPSGVAVGLWEVVLPINWGSVQKEVEPAESRKRRLSSTVLGWSEVSDPPPLLPRLHLWKKTEEQKDPRETGRWQRGTSEPFLFITSIHKIIASHYHSDVEVFSAIRGGRVPLTAEA